MLFYSVAKDGFRRCKEVSYILHLYYKAPSFVMEAKEETFLVLIFFV